MSYIPEYHENYYRVEGTAYNQGKIGIGTINPVQLLHVSGGNIRVDGTGYVNGDLNVTGNLNVYGTAAQFAVSQVIAEDKSIELNVATGDPIGGSGLYSTVPFTDDAGAVDGGIILKSSTVDAARGVRDKVFVYRTGSPTSGWISNLRLGLSGNYGKDTLSLVDPSDSTISNNIGLSISGANTTDAVNLYRASGNVLATDDVILSTISTSGKQTLVLNSQGSNIGMTIGHDTVLYRSGANVLATDDRFGITLNDGKDTLHLSNDAANVGITIGNTADRVELYRSGANVLATDDRFGITIDGGKNTLHLSNNTANVGITIGNDTNLYRSGNNVLSTDDRFAITLGGGKDTLSLTDQTTNVGITFGHYTNLYRTNVGILKTDHNLVVDSGLSVNGDTTLGNSAAAPIDTLTINGFISGLLPDNTTTAMRIRAGSNNYLNIDTNVGTEFVTFGSTPKIKISNNSDSSSSTNGSVQIAGGVGIARKLNVGTDLNVVGNTTLGDAYSDTVLITGKLLRGVLTYSGAGVTTQASSISIANDKVIVTGAGILNGALSLPASIAGMEIEVKNRAGQAINIYANSSPGTDRIFDSSVLIANATALNLANNANKNFVCAPSGGINVWFT
jgi:hypothetical protein